MFIPKRVAYLSSSIAHYERWFLTRADFVAPPFASEPRPHPTRRCSEPPPPLADNMIETHEHAGDFKEVLKKLRRPSLERKKRMAALQLQPPLARPRSTEATPRLRENYVIASVVGKKIRSRARSLLIADHLRRRFARFNLCAHLLDLRCLLFQLRREHVNLFCCSSFLRCSLRNSLSSMMLTAS